MAEAEESFENKTFLKAPWVELTEFRMSTLCCVLKVLSWNREHSGNVKVKREMSHVSV